MKTKLISCMIAVMMLTGCATIGPKIAREAQRPYNDALVYSWKEQLLLNLVRLRYRDDVYFLEVTNVVCNNTLDLSTKVNLKFPHMATPVSQSVEPFIGYKENPVITYVPLQGSAYVKKLLGHIPLKMVMGLANSGWSIERVLKICVQEINGVPNAIEAAGPTPEYLPEYEEFHRLAANLRKLQMANLLKVDTDPNHNKVSLESLVEPDDKDLYFKMLSKGIHDATIREVQTCLNLCPECPRYKFSGNLLGEENPNVIRLKTRTFLGALYYLSQAVEVPQQHIDYGLVNVTLDANGNPVDWCDIIGETLKVHCSSCNPPCTSVKVYYKGYWFYIDDRDLDSKSSFMLLSKLFNIQSSSCSSNTPQLTIPLKG